MDIFWDSFCITYYCWPWNCWALSEVTRKSAV